MAPTTHVAAPHTAAVGSDYSGRRPFSNIYRTELFKAAAAVRTSAGILLYRVSKKMEQ